MLILGFFNFVAELIMVFFTIIIFHPNNKYKKLKSKEDQLFLQKTLLTTIFFAITLLISVLDLLSFISDTIILFLVELFLFNVYVIDIILYNYFLAYELYSTYVNPVHYFNRIFKQKKYNYLYEIIIIIISIIILLIDVVLYIMDLYKIKDNIKTDANNDDKYYYCNDSSLFIIISRWKPILIILISFISLILCMKTKSKIKKFCFKNEEKLYNLISRRQMSNGLYLVYGLFYLLPICVNLTLTEFYNIFGSIFFLIIICQDFLIHISIIASTKFCEYRLKKTLLGYFCSCFIKKASYSNKKAPILNENTINDQIGASFQNETTTALDINTNNPNDKELVSIFKNSIFLEDYFLNYFDQILNIISSSIFYVYSSKYFSSEANEQRLSNNIKIGEDVSCIGGTMQSVSVSNIGGINKTQLSSNSEIGEDIVKFNIKKNMETDDLHRFKEVLENGLVIQNNNNYLNIKIKSYFTPKCIESIYDQKLKGKLIGNSLLSHMILTNSSKNRNPDNPNAFYWSLLAANGKEQHFNKLKNTCIKTYDKNFNLDIFDTDDEDIVFNEGRKNNNLATLLDRYFTYIHGKGIKGTFIPSLVGVFKIKINDFKTLLIFVTRNSLVENVPRSFYTYWQLIRFMNDKPEKIASSQFTSGALVKDDPIFERSFQIETKMDNPNYNKISVKNFQDFKETINNDIDFLKLCGVQNFDLLLMYYEYENTQKHEKQGAIKIKQTKTGTEIIEESLPKGAFLEDENIAPISRVGSKNPDTFGGGFFSLEAGFLDDNDNAGDNVNINNNKNIAKAFDANEKISINGYEGIFDSFNCMCFFTFENIFDIRKRSPLTINYYNNFEKRILVNFTDYRK